jgi:hypothetical protein
MVGNPRELLVATREPTQLRHARTRPQVGLEVYNHSRHETGMISPSRPRESPGLAARGRRRFRKEQISASRVNTNGLTRPLGALDQVVTTGRIRRTRRALFSLVGRIVPSKHTAGMKKISGKTISIHYRRLKFMIAIKSKFDQHRSLSITNTKTIGTTEAEGQGRHPKGRNEMPNRLFHCHDRTGQNAECIKTKKRWIKNAARWRSG